MSVLLQSWHVLLAAICGLVNQRQQQIIEFQNAQIEALLKKLGKKRILLDDNQRRLLAVQAHAIGRKTLHDDSFLPMRAFLENNTATKTIVLPRKSPNLNASIERWFKSLKSEVLDRMIFLGQQSIERAVTNFVQHDHAERNHQGLSNERIEPEEAVGAVAGTIECRERLGGMLKYYHRRAA